MALNRQLQFTSFKQNSFLKNNQLLINSFYSISLQFNFIYKKKANRK